MPTETNFVPPEIDCRDWSEIEPLVRDLLERDVPSPDALERWLLERSDLESYVHETRARLHVEMTCHTDDESKQEALRRFNEDVLPHVRRVRFALDRKYYESPHRSGLDARRYQVFDRDTATDVEIFREENVPLETELALMAQEHSRITGAQTVEFEGRTRTLPEMARYQESPNRSERSEAWLAVAERVGTDRDALRDLFDRMLDRRHRIARNAGFDNYRDYVFREMHRFDYDVAACEHFHEAVEQHVVPFARRIGEERARAMGVDSYRPWDLAADTQGRGPLDPFDRDVDRMVEVTQGVFDAMDRQLGDLFRSLRDGRSLDLDTRPGKAPGGYQTTFAVERRPFIFMNAAGLGRDLRTLVHEAGHAFHMLLGGHDPLFAYRHGPIEFCEVASMSMELTALPFLDVVYRSSEDRGRAARVQLEGVIQLLPWIAQIDAYQHWLYAHPHHSHQEREARWLELDERFGPGVDFSGIEEYRRESWQRQLHLFLAPFYYIEYGIAQLGALQVWLRYRRDPDGTLVDYKKGLSLGGSRPLPELFESTGIRFDFGSDVIRRVVHEVETELASLPA